MRNNPTKAILILLLISICLLVAGCQNLNEANVYIAGYTENSASIRYPCYWLNEARTDLPEIAFNGGEANGIFVLDGDVYVSGYCSGSGAPVPCYWKNDIRYDLLVIDSGKGGKAEDIFVSGTDIYVAGVCFFGNRPTWIPCYWKNGQRTELSVLGIDGLAAAIKVAGTDVFVAGYSTNNSGIKVACRWENGTRFDLQSLSDECDSWGEDISITSSGNALVTGTSDYIGRLEAMSWPQTGSWFFLDRRDPSKSAQSFGNHCSADHIYYGAGYSQNSSGVPIPCFWGDDRERTDLMVPDNNLGGCVTGIFEYEEENYACGFYYLSYFHSHPCYWKQGFIGELPMLDENKNGLAWDIFVAAE